MDSRTPQVYYEGDYIRNLESELSRASKLKCSTCGLKGAGLGCFMKSCRRSYHVPCAIKTSDCRWDFVSLSIYLNIRYIVSCNYDYPKCSLLSDFFFCLQDDFLMMCPVHKAVKFPSERSKFRKAAVHKAEPVAAPKYSLNLVTVFLVNTLPAIKMFD